MTEGNSKHGPLIPSERVVSETIDGEVVAINLESGVYYSLEGPAARAWEAIRDGSDIDGIAAVVAHEAGLGAADVQPDVSEFLRELTAEGLIEGSNGDGAMTDGAGRVSLALNRYTDMEDLIVLDPIHEVDETGWPNRRPL